MRVPVSELVLAQSLGRVPVRVSAKALVLELGQVRVLEPEQVQVQVLVSGQATAQE